MGKHPVTNIIIQDWRILSIEGGKMKKRFLAMVFAALMALSLAACASADEKTRQESAESSAVAQIASLDELLSNLNSAIADTEPGSTARADAIIMQAKADAESPDEDIGNEAASFIVETYPSFYDSAEIMEKSMYCGAYLEYANFNETSAKVGEDTVQAIKYVYRGAESVDDIGTQENLKQIGDLLAKSGYITD